VSDSAFISVGVKTKKKKYDEKERKRGFQGKERRRKTVVVERWVRWCRGLKWHAYRGTTFNYAGVIGKGKKIRRILRKDKKYWPAGLGKRMEGQKSNMLTNVYWSGKYKVILRRHGTGEKLPVVLGANPKLAND